MVQSIVLDYERNLEEIVTATAFQSFSFTFAKSPYEVLELVKEQSFSGFIIDCDNSYNRAVETIQRVKEERPSIQILAVSSLPTVSDAVNLMKQGATEFYCKPLSNNHLLRFLDRLPSFQPHHSSIRNESGLNFREGRQLIGSSEAMAKVFDLIRKLSRVDTSVLIRGESGTGKELVAQALHYNSDRKDGPFVAVNCGAIPENLIESELFGYEKGTFTGADKRRVGKFQYASGGTIFLDEIGDVSAQMQVKLLRVLQEKKISPVGSNQEVAVDVRIISATNKPLEKMIKEGTFRTDLYYRLNVLPITLPPLRERTADIGLLCSFMIDKFNKLHNRSIQGIRPEALQALESYTWPGNIRELENVIEHAFIIENTDWINLEALPQPIQLLDTNETRQEDLSNAGTNGSGLISMVSDFTELKYPILKEQFEREFICKALKAFRGRINQTAEQTQMTKVTLLRKLEKYNINPKEFQH